MIPRLYIAQPLHENAVLTANDAQAHYLRHVLRLEAGTALRVFNETQGEWQAVLEYPQKKTTLLRVTAPLRSAYASPDITVMFAPIKQGRIDTLVEKCTELGASMLQPVFTRYTHVNRVNEARLRAQSIEAAEQCERLDIPTWRAAVTLTQLLADWPAEKLLLYGDETGNAPPLPQLLPLLPPAALCLLIGPEGGFSAEEHSLLKAQPFVRGYTLGPRILRADTAAIASLTCLMAANGDWQHAPRFHPDK